ncbi:hypothetical protein [Rhizobium sp. S163]|uniref:hypothetical protein n=1 Tax=Rhizobium sp. S163 TaxID=3055039 RepID=UPI0025A9711F|nr:hypothetical protein [Rhizobium sp. S163]MDM9646445.1 hypothetical protein [Rhizobium sp. S163]
MADDSTVTIRATFETRETADIAVEHLVQQLGISRPDVFVQSTVEENTSGSRVSGGDASRGGADRSDAQLAGDVEVSADISSMQIAKVNRIFGDLGAIRVSRS